MKHNRKCHSCGWIGFHEWTGDELNVLEPPGCWTCGSTKTEIVFADHNNMQCPKCQTVRPVSEWWTNGRLVCQNCDATPGLYYR